MPILEIGAVISTIAQYGAEALIDRARKSEAVVAVLKRLNMSADTPPADFEGVYVYALVEYGVGTPPPLLEIFRNSSVKAAFRMSFEARDLSIVENEIDSLVQSHELSENFRKLDVSTSEVVRAFSKVFGTVVDRSRTPADIRRDQALSDIRGELGDIGLATSDAVREFRAWKEGQAHQGQPSKSATESLAVRDADSSPALPDYYVPRNSLLQNLRDMFELTTEGRLHTPAKKLVAIVGLGGAGKSVLALSLIADNDFQTTFKDGYLWATIPGELPADTAADRVLSEWLITVGVDPQPLLTTALKLQVLRQILSTQQRLLVIDDVFDNRAARLLLDAGGANCSCLIITRDRELPLRLGISQIVSVGKLTEPEAQSLVENRLGTTISNQEWQMRVKPFLEHVDWHALAVSLAAAQVSLGDVTWDSLTAAIEKAQTFASIDFTEPNERAESLNKTFELSIRTLDPDTLERFAWLGVLSRGRPFSAPSAGAIWSGRPGEIERRQPRLAQNAEWEWEPEIREKDLAVLKLLFRRGLIELVSPDVPIYQMHSLLHDYALVLLRQRNEIDKALIHHSWVFFSITMTDSASPLHRWAYPFIQAQVFEVLERAWRRHKGLSGLVIRDEDVARRMLVGLVIALSRYWRRRGHWSELILWSDRAIDASRSRGDLEAERELLDNLGNAYLDMGKPERARPLFEASVDISVKLNNLSLQIDDLCQIGITYLDTEPEKALPYLERALAVARKQGVDSSLGFVLAQLGTVNTALKKFDKAIELLEEALSIATKAQDSSASAYRLANLANATLGKAKQLVEVAVSNLYESHRIARFEGNRRSEATRLVMLGQAHAFLSKHKLANICLSEAVRIYEEVDSPKVEDARRTLAYINGGADLEVNPIPELDMFLLANDTCIGDPLARARLIPWLEKVQTLSEAPKDFVRLARNLSALIEGERDSAKLCRGLNQSDTVNMLVVLVNLATPGKGGFLTTMFTTISAIIQGEKGARDYARVLIEDLSIPPQSLDEDSEALANILKSVLAGERSPVLLPRQLKDPLTAKAMRVLLELHQN
jgi:tetratricopeptide (TPR) repeat protein